LKKGLKINELERRTKKTEGNNSVTIDKGTIPHLVARFRKETQPMMPPLERLTQITMSSGPTDDFIAWYKKLR